MKKVLLGIFILSQISNGAIASWYEKGFEGKTTASGYIYNSKQFTCASNVHKFGTVLKVTSKDTGKSVLTVVTDRGSFDKKYGRNIDLSKRSFAEIDNIHKGLINVNIEIVDTSKVFKYKHGNPVFNYKNYVN